MNLDLRLRFLAEGRIPDQKEIDASEQVIGAFLKRNSFYNTSEDKQQSRDLALSHLESVEDPSPIFLTLPSIFWSFEKQALKNNPDWKFVGVESERALKEYFKRGMPNSDELEPKDLTSKSYITPNAIGYVGTTSDYLKDDNQIILDGGWIDYESQLHGKLLRDLNKLGKISRNGSKWVISILGAREHKNYQAKHWLPIPPEFEGQDDKIREHRDIQRIQDIAHAIGRNAIMGYSGDYNIIKDTSGWLDESPRSGVYRYVNRGKGKKGGSSMLMIFITITNGIEEDEPTPWDHQIDFKPRTSDDETPLYDLLEMGTEYLDQLNSATYKEDWQIANDMKKAGFNIANVNDLHQKIIYLLEYGIIHRDDLLENQEKRKDIFKKNLTGKSDCLNFRGKSGTRRNPLERKCVDCGYELRDHSLQSIENYLSFKAARDLSVSPRAAKMAIQKKGPHPFNLAPHGRCGVCDRPPSAAPHMSYRKEVERIQRVASKREREIEFWAQKFDQLLNKKDPQFLALADKIWTRSDIPNSRALMRAYLGLTKEMERTPLAGKSKLKSSSQDLNFVYGDTKNKNTRRGDVFKFKRSMKNVMDYLENMDKLPDVENPVISDRLSENAYTAPQKLLLEGWEELGIEDPGFGDEFNQPEKEPLDPGQVLFGKNVTPDYYVIRLNYHRWALMPMGKGHDVMDNLINANYTKHSLVDLKEKIKTLDVSLVMDFKDWDVEWVHGWEVRNRKLMDMPRLDEDG